MTVAPDASDGERMQLAQHNRALEDGESCIDIEGAKDALFPEPTTVVEGNYASLVSGDGHLIDEGEYIADFDPDADYEALQDVIAGEAARYAEAAEKVEPFPNAEAAIAWGIAQQAFGAPGEKGTAPHARAAYNKIKTEPKPATAEEMATLWRADVARRLAEAEAQA